MAEPKWFDADDLPLPRMLPSDRLWLPRILAGEKLIGEVWHNRNLTGFSKEPVFTALTPEQLAALWWL